MRCCCSRQSEPLVKAVTGDLTGPPSQPTGLARSLRDISYLLLLIHPYAYILSHVPQRFG